MDTFTRRCYSEYGASSASKTTSLIPSHVATKIREVQLLKTNSDRLLPGNEKDVDSHPSSNSLRHLSSSKFSSRLPKSLPSWRTTQFTAKRQLDGADNLPSIDTVLADPDKTRNMAETEFYEHIDADGIVRRKSMVRTVNKDDCLRGRGANPRTGMVTPDDHSIAGSLDSVAEPRGQMKLPSAQWKLKNNQWISELQDEDEDIKSSEGSPRVIANQSQPLTSNNLRSFSHSLLEDPKHRLQSPSTQAILSVGKIRRKPLGTPSKVSSNSGEGHTQRSVSEDTVIRTPPIVPSNPGSEKMTSFFSPEDVGRVQGVAFSSRQARHQHDRLPFLGQLAKPYQVPSTEGFAKGKKNLVQLEKSLRMNDGPFPLPPSMLHATLDHDGTQPRAFLPAAPRVYFSDLASQYHPKQLSHPGYSDTYQDRRLRQERSANMSPHGQENHLQTRMKDDPQSFPKTGRSRRANFNTSTPSSTKQSCRPDRDRMQEDQSLWKPDTLPESDPSVPNGLILASHMPQKSSGAQDHITGAIKRRPPLGPRKNEMASPSAVRPKVIHTVEKAHSKSTGMLTTPDGEDVVRTSEAGKFNDDLPCPTGSANTVDESHDHSTCCPRCCTEYNCHEGCLGHSPLSEVDKSETSSLLSMGVFEASFETSVKAINDILLTPQNKRTSALAKLRHAFVESLWQGDRSPSREPNKQAPLKRTLRQPSPVRGRPIISNPIISQENSKQSIAVQAEAAAQKAMDFKVRATKRQPRGPRPAQGKGSPASMKKLPTITGSTPHKNGANEGRKVSAAATSTEYADDVCPEEEAEKATKQVINDFDNKSNTVESAIANIGTLIRQNSVSEPLQAIQPIILKYAPLLFVQLQEMVMVILDTLTILSCMICDYKRTGIMVLPETVSLTELMGNCLRTLLYLMIAVCLYALLVKVSRIVLCTLRILLFPVRLCAWIIG